MAGKSCTRCEKSKVDTIILDDSIDVAGHTFTTQLPADRCNGCGEIVVQGHHMQLFELKVALELAHAGTRDPQAFKFMRKALQMTPEAFASLLEVTPDVIGYWENGDWPVDPRALNILCSLVTSKLEGEARALDCLGVLRQPRRLAKKVRVSLHDAMGVAGRLLAMGVGAKVAPAC